VKTSSCKNCGVVLDKDTIALNKKLLSIDMKEFYCLECLADTFDCSVDDLKIKIEEFKEEGCTLFK
jgi:biotin operon repressor